MPDEARTRRVWTLGSYPDIAPNFLAMAGHLVAAAAVDAGEAVLDVACGTGNVAITAARRGAAVTGLDVTPAMLEDARENAAIAGVEGIDWREGNATELPFADDAFDVTLSCVGHVFADPPDEAAAELVRVTRPGGRVAFTSWTPTSVVPAMVAAMEDYLPPRPDPPAPPFLWGDPDVASERLADAVTDLEFEPGTVHQPVLSPAHFWEAARTLSGPFIAALEDVDERDLPALRSDVVDAIGTYFDDRENAVVMDYRLATGTVA